LTEGAQPGSPREELAELAAAVRAYVEWQADTGAAGLPVEAAPAAVLTAIGGGSGGRAATRPAAPPAFTAPPWRAADAPARTGHDGGAETPPPVPARSAAPRPPEHDAAPKTQAAPPPAPTTPDERRTRLALLAEEARSCTRCVLHEQRRQAVFSRGDPFAELMFVGEGPGADEDARGEPFVGAAGQLLDRMIAAMGYHRDEVYIANIVKCRPPNNRKPEPEETASCMPFLTQQLGLVKPRVIVALGATAVQGLCGTTEGITRLRGKWKLYKGSTPIMPTFHPAYLLRNPAAKREVWADLQEVMKHLGKAPPRAPKPQE
jgi:uracil-DNA glycosylase